MASIYKRKNANGTSVWRAVIRIKGYPSVSAHFDRKQEAEDRAKVEYIEFNKKGSQLERIKLMKAFIGYLLKYLNQVCGRSFDINSHST